MNKIFNFLSSTTKFQRSLPQKKILEIPNFLDIYNRESNLVKQDVMNAFFEQVKSDSELLNKAYLFNLSYVLVQLVNFFGDFNPIAIYFQITSLDSLVVKCENHTGINFYAETFFDTVTGYQIETVVNVFKGPEQLYNDSGEFEEILSSMKQSFEPQELDYVTYLNYPVDYEVSAKSFATADF